MCHPVRPVLRTEGRNPDELFGALSYIMSLVSTAHVVTELVEIRGDLPEVQEAQL
jgi:hypothetical protein